MSQDQLLRQGTTVCVAAALVATLNACTMGHDSGQGAKSASPSSTVSSSTSSTTADPTAEVAFSKVRSFVTAATSTSVEAHGQLDHQQSTVTLNGDLDNDPTKTHVAMGPNGTADLLTIGQTYYVKGDSSYWEKAAETSKSESATLAGKWFKAPKSSLGSDADSLTPKSITDEVTDTNGNIASKFQSSSSHLAKTTYENQAAYELTGDDGKTKVWCTADGKYTLLKVEQPDNPEDFSTATFKDWNVKPQISAPKGAINLPGESDSGSSKGGTDGGTTT